MSVEPGAISAIARGLFDEIEPTRQWREVLCPGAVVLRGFAVANERALLDAWGTSAIASSGELATRFPPARPWEDVVGHDASAGLAA